MKIFFQLAFVCSVGLFGCGSQVSQPGEVGRACRSAPFGLSKAAARWTRRALPAVILATMEHRVHTVAALPQPIEEKAVRHF